MYPTPSPNVPRGVELPQLRTPGLESHLHEDKDCVNMIRGGLDVIYNGTVLIMFH